ncbi:hypothetical protein K9M74_00215 [Candidatus Woesearchaeota archaeon]|nr:hypothetical protein [Candidatus Woesearchaeota archaeon]
MAQGNKMNANKTGVKQRKLISFSMKFCILVVITLLFSSFAFADETSLSIQGKLVNASSGAVLSGSFSTNFSIYDAYSGGSPLWSQVSTITADSRGVYSVELRGITLDFDVPYYLGVNVAGDGEMSPRYNLTSSPYSFSASGLNETIILNNNVSFDSGTLFIDTTNNRLGIGTINPSEQLTMKANEKLAWEYTSGSGTAFHWISGGGVNPMNFTVNSFSADTSIYSFNGNSGNVMTILNGGNVGINTTTPTALLDVDGNFTANEICLGGVCESAWPAGSGSSDAGGWTNTSTETVTSLKVGVGTTSATQHSLHVQDGSVYIDDDSAGTRQGLGLQYASGSIFWMNPISTTVLGIGGAGTSAPATHTLYLTATGDVGIGTASPDDILHIFGANKRLKLEGEGDSNIGTIIYSNSTYKSHIGYSSGSDGLIFAHAESGLTNFNDIDMIIKDGNVGIGTNSPESILHLKDSDTHITLESTGAGDASYGFIEIKDSTGETMGFSGFDSGSNADYTIRTYNVSDGIDFQTNGSNSRMYINQEGNVGIGTTSPLGLLNVHSTGPTTLGLSSTRNLDGQGIGILRFYGQNDAGTPEDVIYSQISTGITDASDGTEDGNLNFWTMKDGTITKQVTINEAGNVGIGTVSPDQLLDIEGGNILIDNNQYYMAENTIGTNVAIAFIDSSNVTGLGGVFSGAETSIRSAGGEAIRIDTSGNVGIGTSSPDEKLSIFGNSGGTYLEIHDQRSTVGDLAGIKLGTMPSGQTTNMKTMIAHIETGNYGIGDLVFALNPSVSDSEVTISDEVMRIKNSGDVGIGTTSPSKTLEVSDGTKGITFDPDPTDPVINTTSGDIVITSAGGDVIIQLG